MEVTHPNPGIQMTSHTQMIMPAFSRLNHMPEEEQQNPLELSDVMKIPWFVSQTHFIYRRDAINNSKSKSRSRMT